MFEVAYRCFSTTSGSQQVAQAVHYARIHHSPLHTSLVQNKSRGKYGRESWADLANLFNAVLKIHSHMSCQLDTKRQSEGIRKRRRRRSVPSMRADTKPKVWCKPVSRLDNFRDRISDLVDFATLGPVGKTQIRPKEWHYYHESIPNPNPTLTYSRTYSWTRVWLCKPSLSLNLFSLIPVLSVCNDFQGR